MTRLSFCLFILLLTFVVWLTPHSSHGQDSINYQAQEPPAVVVPGVSDTVHAEQTDTLMHASSDSSFFSQDPVFKLFTTLLEPLAYTIAVGGVLLILFTKRGK
ncbi:MAG: hypothetical protein NTW14_01925 [bacterium]|nr:hypothetical protein [bacterium]